MNFKQLVKELIIRAQTELRADVLRAIESARQQETEKARKHLDILLENAALAKEQKRPICQDTGVLHAYVEIPEGWPVPAGLENSLEKAVADAYRESGFRMSTVYPPVGARKNRGDNTPPVIRVFLSSSDRARISVMPKGAGSENVSFLMMVNPTTAEDEVVAEIAGRVISFASKACPPLVLGVCLGGTFDSAPVEAKKALLDEVDTTPGIGEMIKDRVNRSGIGPFGLGGKTTVLGVRVVEKATHIASLPVAVSVSCHALRSASMNFSREEWLEICQN